MEDFVKKRLQSLSFYATLGAVLGIMSWGGLLNAQTQGTQQPSTAPSAGSTPSAQQGETPAQTSPGQTGQQGTPPASANSNSSSSAGANGGAAASDNGNANGVQTFTGTVTKQGEKYVLQDSATGKTYDIDHQDEVKKFDGKRVRVHGTLSGNMIHVQ